MRLFEMSNRLLASQKLREICLTSIFSIIAVLNFSVPVAAQILVTVVGNGTAGFSGDGGPAIAARLNSPSRMIFDVSGNMYIADAFNNCIRRVDHVTGIITTFAGKDSAGYSGDGGPATLAKLHQPQGLAIDGSGNLFIADNINNRIRQVDASGIISTVAGVGSMGYSGDGGPATLAALHNPADVVVDGAGNMFIADGNNNCIRKVSITGIISTIAGTGTAGFGGDGSPATAALLSAPAGLALGSPGTLYIADRINNRIRKIDAGGIISTVAGTGLTYFSGDGMPATASNLTYPPDVALDAFGNMYIADAVDYRVRKVNTSGIISTVAGNGIMGFTGDSCAAIGSELNDPWGVAIDGSGHLYIADALNNRIRMIAAGHSPVFTHGHSQFVIVCKNDITASMDSLLAISDSDANQSEIWSLLLAPTHGAAIIADTLISSGGMLTPSSLSYTPATGYTGPDTLRVLITDCGNETDTTSVYVSVVNCALANSAISGMKTNLFLYPNPAMDDLFVKSEAGSPCSFTITNSIGQMLKQGVLSDSTTNISVRSFPHGLYYIHMFGDDYHVVRKFLKQ